LCKQASTKARARKAAKARGTTIGRWIAEKVENSWPPEVLAKIGKFPDFPDLDELRSGYGKDATRERLD
jgi:hypothetical protein